MNCFVSVRDGIATKCYITRVTEDRIYYGHFIPGHENKAETAVMSKWYYNKLVKRDDFSQRYIIGVVKMNIDSTMKELAEYIRLGEEVIGG